MSLHSSGSSIDHEQIEITYEPLTVPSPSLSKHSTSDLPNYPSKRRKIQIQDPEQHDINHPGSLDERVFLTSTPNVSTGLPKFVHHLEDHHTVSNAQDEDADLAPMELEDEPPHLSEKKSNPYKRARLTSPQPDRGTKRSSSILDTPTSTSLKPTKAKKAKIEEPHPPDLKLIKNLKNLKFQIAKSRLRSLPSSSINFVTSQECRTKYADQADTADILRVEGNEAFMRKDYKSAIRLYTSAAAEYPRELTPGSTFHPGYSTSLANRAAAEMALGDYDTATLDLQKSLESVHLTPLLTSELRSTLVKRILRLVRCHLATLNSQAAYYTLEHLWDPDSPVHIGSSHDASFQEASILSSRAKLVLELERRIEKARILQRWLQVLESIRNIEARGSDWGLKWSINHNLPGLWSFWKAEALARLGQSLEAHEAVVHQLPSLPPKQRHLIQALIAFSGGSLEEASRHFDGVLIIDPDDSIVRQMFSRTQAIITKLCEIDKLVSIGSSEAVKLCEQLLPNLKGPISTMIRINVQLILCTQLVKVSQNGRRQSQLCTSLISTVNNVLMIEIKYWNSDSDPSSVYKLHRPYVIDLMIIRARATRNHLPILSKSSYQEVLDLLTKTWKEEMPRTRESLIEECRTNLDLNDMMFTDRDHKGYYKILDLDRDASLKQIKRSFKLLSLTHHPDKGGDTATFQTINEAYSILSDPKSRYKYDEGIL